MALMVYGRSAGRKLTHRQEGNSPIITLEDDKPEHVLAMLEHCYPYDDEDVRRRHWDQKNLIFDAEMLCLADKYQCKPLAEHIAAYFRKLGDQYNLSSLVNGQSLVDALDLIYSLPSGSLLDMFREHFWSDFKNLLLRRPGFKDLYKKHHVLAQDVIVMLADHTC